MYTSPSENHFMSLRLARRFYAIRFVPLFLLILGMFLLDKKFAYLGIPGTLIYITEMVLIGVLYLQMIYICIRRRSEFPIPPFKYLITLYLLCGVTSLVRGAGNGLDAVRDFVLVYYFGFAFLTMIYINSIERFRVFVQILIFGWIISTAYFWLRFFLRGNYLPSQLGEAHSMFSGMALIFLTITFSIRRHKNLTIFLLFCIIADLILYQVRSAWIGMIAAFGIISALQLKSVSFRRSIFHPRMIFLGSVLVVMSFAGWMLETPFFSEASAEFRSVLYFWDKSGQKAQLTSIGTARYRVAMWSDLIRDVLSDPVTMFLGKPMGTPFLPPSGAVMEDVKSGKGMDPHNSHLAILYRMGLIGFAVYLLLIGLTIKRTVQLLKLPYLNRELRIHLLGLLGIFFVVIVNGCFSVILESPHKAIFFWIILGSIFAGHRLIHRQYVMTAINFECQSP